jgi:hypothetical protein
MLQMPATGHQHSTGFCSYGMQGSHNVAAACMLPAPAACSKTTASLSARPIAPARSEHCAGCCCSKHTAHLAVLQSSKLRQAQEQNHILTRDKEALTQTIQELKAGIKQGMPSCRASMALLHYQACVPARLAVFTKTNSLCCCLFPTNSLRRPKPVLGRCSCRHFTQQNRSPEDLLCRTSADMPVLTFWYVACLRRLLHDPAIP